MPNPADGRRKRSLSADVTTVLKAWQSADNDTLPQRLDEEHGVEIRDFSLVDGGVPKLCVNQPLDTKPEPSEPLPRREVT